VTFRLNFKPQTTPDTQKWNKATGNIS